LFVGCISGTSVDGLDLALIGIDHEQVHFQHAYTAELPPELRAALLDLGQPETDDLDLLGYCDSALGAFIGQAIVDFLAVHGVDPNNITAIGSHGQTVRHRPPDKEHSYGFSTQIGDPNLIAEITGIQTVADFRRRDMAAAGHGAPLVPPFHQALFGPLAAKAVVLNVGGISNISILGSPPRGFDTGPGNALMDVWCETHTGQTFDKNGAWAASGKVDQTLLQKCLADPFFQLTPPKSTGREYFNTPWLNQQLIASNAKPEDVQATLCALTARCTTDALKRWAPSANSLIVCGGGRLNLHLMEELAKHSGEHIEVSASERWQVDGDSIEAALFAWLAHRRLNHLPGNEPAVTGAGGYRVLGAIYAR
jgi:anhydro-N-acetylmuramic acid kinase